MWHGPHEVAGTDGGVGNVSGLKQATEGHV